METKNDLNQKGFTLIEVLVALAVGAILMGAVLSIFKSQVDTHNLQDEVVTVEQNLRAAMEMIVSDLRMAGWNVGQFAYPFDVGTLTVETLTKGTLTLESDNDPNRKDADALAIRKASDSGIRIAAHPGNSRTIDLCDTATVYAPGDALFIVREDYREALTLVVESFQNDKQCQTGQPSQAWCAPENCDIIKSTSNIEKAYVGGTLYTLEVNTYYITHDFDEDGNADDPALMMVKKVGDTLSDPVAVAFGIRDMQVTYDPDVATQAETAAVTMVTIYLEGITPHAHKIGFGGTAAKKWRSLTTKVKLRNMGLDKAL